MTERENLAWWRPDGSGAAILDVTLGDILDQQAEAFGDRAAVLVDEQGGARSTALTFAELKTEVDAIARGLLALGVARGDHIAVMAPNCIEWVLLEHALAKVGAVLVTVNTALRQSEVEYLLQQGKVRMMIFAPQIRDNNIAANLASLMPDLSSDTQGRRDTPDALPDLEVLIGIGPNAPDFAMPFDRLRDLAQDVPQETLTQRQAEVQCTDIVQIQYTSGTTGKPKGAMLTHRSTVNNARFMAERGGFRHDDVLLSAMPLFHAAGCVCNLMSMLVTGGRFITMDAFDAERMLQLWAENQPTMINAVPTMFTRMMEHPDFAQHGPRNLRIASTGGTSIPPSLMRSLKQETGAEPLIIMGMTECSPLITQTNPEDDFETRITTAGTPLPHTEIRIVNVDTGETCGWDESGELCIRGYLTMSGYFDMPEKTAETIDSDGWLHSGDLAELSASGHLKIVGRLKDMIIRGGENVYPVEIEDCLLDDPGVSQAQVVGVPDPDLGEEICAFVVMSAGAAFDQQALQQHCRTNMARHKMPKYIAAIDAMPLTANGKIQKFALRDQAAKMIADGSLSPVPR